MNSAPGSDPSDGKRLRRDFATYGLQRSPSPPAGVQAARSLGARGGAGLAAPDAVLGWGSWSLVPRSRPRWHLSVRIGTRVGLVHGVWGLTLSLST